MIYNYIFFGYISTDETISTNGIYECDYNFKETIRHLDCNKYIYIGFDWNKSIKKEENYQSIPGSFWASSKPTSNSNLTIDFIDFIDTNPVTEIKIILKRNKNNIILKIIYYNPNEITIVAEMELNEDVQTTPKVIKPFIKTIGRVTATILDK